MPTRVLLLLSQNPFDPASGAARSMRTMCEMLAASRSATNGEAEFQVRAVATTATEHGSPDDPVHVLETAGNRLTIEPATEKRPRVLRFDHAGVHYTILDTGTGMVQRWEPVHGQAFDALLDVECKAWRPDILLTFGGQPGECARRKRIRDLGAAVVFGLRNHGYMTSNAFEDVDAIITPSRFLSGLYREKLGLRSTPLAVPISTAEVLASERQPVFFTFVNPTVFKGVMFFARLAEVVSNRRPDIPFMVVESRGTAGHLVQAGLAAAPTGFDLRRHKNIVCSPGVSEPRHIYAATRVMLVPSVWEEPSGRVSAEALVNGVPPIVSDRGGLPETVADGGFVLPLPKDLTTATSAPVPPEAVAEWAAMIERLADDEQFYSEACWRARDAGKALQFDRLAPLYAAFFRGVKRGPDVQMGPFE